MSTPLTQKKVLQEQAWTLACTIKEIIRDERTIHVASEARQLISVAQNLDALYEEHPEIRFMSVQGVC